jgi:fimbrial isopeptide formation D2 family protein/LPXTG-motif cell wall-anchored protein
MKRFKKYLSLILMVIFTLSMSMAAFADTGKITIADSTNEQHQAYKIFDAEVTPIYNADHQEVDQRIDYFIDNTSYWFDKVNDFEGLEFTYLRTEESHPGDPDSGTKDIYRVSWGTGFSAADFADRLMEYVNYTTPDKTGTDSITNLEYGYYLITTTKDGYLQPKAALASVIKDEIIIQDKNDMPFDKTVMDKDPTTGDPIQVKEKDVKVGDILEYTIKGKVPDTTNDTFYAYLVSDTLTEGLTFNKHVTVEIVDNNYPYNSFIVDLDELTTTAITPGNDEIKYREDGFDLSLDVLYRGQNKPGSDFTMAGFDIVITYTAVVNDKAVAEVSKNLATLNFGNDPQDLQYRDSEVKVYSSKIVIDKFENGATEQKLADAEFVLRKPDIDANDATSGNSYLYYRYVENTESTVPSPEERPAPRVEWFKLTDVVYTTAFSTFLDDRYNMTLDFYNYTLSDEERENIAIEYAVEQGLIKKVTTDKDGVAEFKGLEDGKYELVEIKAPSGYTLLAAPVVVEVDGTDATTVGLTQEQSTVLLTEIAHIANTPGQLIPSTGGMGTTLFYIVGAIMVFGAVVVLVTRRKMSE